MSVFSRGSASTKALVAWRFMIKSQSRETDHPQTLGDARIAQYGALISKLFSDKEIQSGRIGELLVPRFSVSRNHSASPRLQ